MARQKVNGNGSSHPAEPPEAPSDHDATQMIDLTVQTLSGDMRDFILDRLRNEQDKRPWDKRSEADQRDTIHRVESACERVLRKAVELIAGEGRRAIQAKLESCTVKDGIKATILLSRFDEQRHTLLDATGASVLIVVADPDQFTGERAPAPVTPDQPALLDQAGVVHSQAHDTPFN